MVKIYFDKDVNLDVIKGETIAVIGYGSQGRAQAMNMRDSGLNVIVGLRPEGASWERARLDGFKVYPIDEAVKIGDIIFMLVPDMIQPDIYKKYIEPNLSEGKVLDFAHGFNIHFGQIIPPKNIDVIMVAPKAPGPRLRETFLSGFGVPALIAVYQDYSGRAREIALAIAKALGCTRAGVIETTFKDETESDLIGEQTVLVGGLIELIKKGFEVLVECGYPPELAYFEACNEAKLIMDLIYEKGIVGMLKAVSETARYGGLTVGPKVIDEHVKENMRRAALRVRSGEFAKEWINEFKSGGENLKRLLKEIEEHPIEKVGSLIRRMSGLERG
ncbi:MAG: ketol-acid reductoisomerase [Candidatus Bathyarchaeia archaeon]|nr:ketol-acid reductoisomerase [Candidatus Bathyarchaeota archaeon]